MDLVDVAKAQAAGRVLVGAGLTLAPRLAGAGWIGPVSGERPVTVFSRALGIRDAVLGIGLLRSAGRANTKAMRPWMLAGLAADVVDAAASLEARAEMPRSGQIMGPAVAGGSALLGAWLVAKLG